MRLIRLLFACSLVGCGPAPPLHPETPRVVEAPPAEEGSHETVVRIIDEPMHWARTDWLWIVRRDADRVLVVDRGRRIVIEGGHAQYAEHELARNFTCVARVDEGWLFVTADGVIALAREFLGEPTILGQLPEQDGILIGYQEGRALAQFRRRLHTIDGAGRVAELPGVPSGPVTETIADGARILVDVGGRARISTDGGPFRDLRIGRNPITRITRVDGGVLLATERNEDLFLASDGVLRAFDGDDDIPMDIEWWAGAGLSDEERVEITRAAIARDPAAAHAFEMTREGAVVPRGRDLDVFDPSTGALVTTYSGALPGDRCDLEPWGRGFFARCDGGQFWSQQGTPAFRPVDAGRDDVRILGDGGRAIVRCDDRNAMCLLDAGAGTVGPVSGTTDAMNPVALVGSTLVVTTHREGTTTALDLDRGTREDFVRCDDRAPIGSAEDALRAAEGIWLVHTARAAFVGTPRCMRAVPLPHERCRVGFHGARGIAYCIDTIHRTNDLGAHWEALDLPGYGMRDHEGPWFFDEHERHPIRVTCDASGCLVRGRRDWRGYPSVLIRGWDGPVRFVDRPVISAERRRRTR